jgi:hypothetical protein
MNDYLVTCIVKEIFDGITNNIILYLFEKIRSRRVQLNDK